MSEQKNFEKYLNNEWYPGCPVGKSEWRQKTEADFAKRGIEMDSRTNVVRAVARTTPVKPSQYKKIDKPLCPACGARMNQNLYGICRNCARRFRGMIEQKSVMVCDEPGCMKTLRGDCKFGKCSTHYSEVRKVRRQQRKAEMKKAA